MIIHGRNTVTEAIKLGLVRKLHLRQGSTFEADDRLRVIEYSRKEFNAEFGDEAQGVAAEVQDIETLDFYENIEQIAENGPIVILDRIMDPQNYGTIMRAAHCFGIKSILVGVDKQAPITPAVCKASSGTIFYMNIYSTPGTAKALARLSEEGYRIFAADVHADKTLDEADFIEKSAIILGSEGKGIRPGLLDKCDSRIFIPIKGEIDSLNVSQSASVIFYEYSMSLKKG